MYGLHLGAITTSVWPSCTGTLERESLKVNVLEPKGAKLAYTVVHLLLYEGRVTCGGDMLESESRGVMTLMRDLWTLPRVSPTWHSNTLWSISSSSRSTSFFYWKKADERYSLSLNQLPEPRLMLRFYIRVICQPVKAVQTPEKRVLLYCYHCSRWQQSHEKAEAGERKQRLWTGAHQVLFKSMITVLRCALGSLLRCICCRDGGLGWASEVRWVSSCGASVPGVSARSPMLPNGIDPWPAGWAGEVFPGLVWLEVGEVEGFCS